MANKPEILKVEEEAGAVFVTIPVLNSHHEQWTKTTEALHTLLARLGYKRIRKQTGSQIGGEYQR